MSDERERRVFEFDEPEARGRIVVERCYYGLAIHVDEGAQPPIFVDLYPRTRGDQPPQILLYDPDGSDEPLVIVTLAPGGAVFHLTREGERARRSL